MTDPILPHGTLITRKEEFFLLLRTVAKKRITGTSKSTHIAPSVLDRALAPEATAQFLGISISSGMFMIQNLNILIPVFCHLQCAPVHNAHPCFCPKLSGKKIFCFNSLIPLFIYLYFDTCFLYYKVILAFIFEQIMIREILRNE